MDSKGKRSRSPSKKLHGAARLAQSELDELDIGIIRSCKRHQPEVCARPEAIFVILFCANIDGSDILFLLLQSDGSSLSRLSITLDGSVTSGEQCEACPMDMMPSEPMRSPSSTGHTMSSLGCSESDSGCMTGVVHLACSNPLLESCHRLEGDC